MARADLITQANRIPSPVQEQMASPVKPVREVRPEVREQEPVAKPTGREPEELDHVIAVSKDGDTVQASDEAIRELDEEEQIGRMISDPDNARIRKEQEEKGPQTREELLELELERSEEIRKAQIEQVQEESKERREAALQQATEEEEPAGPQEEPNAVLADEKQTIAEQGQVSSFIGYSDAELERMYLQGNISKHDYDQEMENRAAKEEARKEELADFSIDTSANIAEAEETERAGQEIEQAFSDEANERLDAATRAQVLQTMQRTQAPEDNDPNSVTALTNFALT